MNTAVRINVLVSDQSQHRISNALWNYFMRHTIKSSESSAADDGEPSPLEVLGAILLTAQTIDNEAGIPDIKGLYQKLHDQFGIDGRIADIAVYRICNDEYFSYINDAASGSVR